MATKTIDYLEKMVTIAHYEHEGFEYDTLHLSVMYRKGVGFFVSYQPVKRNGFGGFETGPLPSDDPLVGGKTLLAENADKNNAKRLQQMMANLEAGTEAVVWLFDHREWDKLNIAIVRLVRDGYTEKYRQQMHDLMAETGCSEKKGESPMMRQFNDLKAKHPDAMLLFRCGDFYECYCDDAREAAKILGITLTWRTPQKRHAPGDYTDAMAGFPHHALDTYLPKLIRAGKRVAICDMLPDPPKPTVKRGETESDNNSNNQNSTTMTQNFKAADLIGKVIVLGENIAKYIVKSIDGDKLVCDFIKDGMETMPMSVPVKQAEKFIADGKWKVSETEDATVVGGVVVAMNEHHDITTEADVQEVQDIVPVVTKKPTPKAEEPKEEKPVAIVKPMETKPKAEPKPKAKTQPSAVKPQTSGKYVYATYQTSKGKTGAKITGVSETDAAYQQAAAIHASGSYERDKDGNKHFYLCFGPRYAEAAKKVCELLNAGKPIEDAIAVVNAATEERATKREEWKQKREERKANAANATSSKPMNANEQAMFELFKKFMAGDATAMQQVGAMMAKAA